MNYASIAWKFTKDHYYMPLIIGVLVVVIGFTKVTAPEVTASAEVSLLVKENSRLKADLKARSKAYAEMLLDWEEPIPQPEGCPACPRMPRIRVNCGGDGGASGSGEGETLVSVTGTAKAELNLESGSSIVITGGIYTTVRDWEKVSADLAVGNKVYSAGYQYENGGVHRIGIRRRLLEF